MPSYTRAEENFNSISHVIGIVLSIFVLGMCLQRSISTNNTWGLYSSLVYSVAMIILYSCSSIYHGLKDSRAKRVFQVLDHCSIFLLIAGTYTVILLGSVRVQYPIVAWLLFGMQWAMAILGVVFNSIDLKRYNVVCMIFYILMGWSIIFILPVAISALTIKGFLWVLIGGICFTIGSVIYGIGAKKSSVAHCYWHIFVILGTVFHFLAIISYVL